MIRRPAHGSPEFGFEAQSRLGGTRKTRPCDRVMQSGVGAPIRELARPWAHGKQHPPCDLVHAVFRSFAIRAVCVFGWLAQVARTGRVAPCFRPVKWMAVAHSGHFTHQTGRDVQRGRAGARGAVWTCPSPLGATTEGRGAFVGMITRFKPISAFENTVPNRGGFWHDS